MKFVKLIFSFYFVGFIFTCTSPQNPFSQDKAKVYLHLESSSKTASDSAITDTTGNTIRIGVVFFMPEYFDSVVIMVQKSIQDVDTFFVCKKPNIGDSTAWFSYSFKSGGTRTVTATGYVEDGYKPTATATITVIARPVNHKPHLIITGKESITTMDACTLFVSVSDSDTTQAHSFQVLKAPSGYAFANQIFTWKPATPADTGIDSITFTVADNGVPVMSDTQTVAIMVSAPIGPANHKPVLVVTGRTSITTADVCSLFVSAHDEDSTQRLTYKVSTDLQGYAFSNQIFTWKPAATDTGTDTVTFIVADNGTPPLSDSQKIIISVSINNAIPLPVVISQPNNQTICSGSLDSFVIAASGTGPLKYQWQKNNANVASDTNRVLKFPAVSTSDSGSYKCIVSNAGGSVSSDSARLTVTTASILPAGITFSSSSICSGRPDTFKGASKYSSILHLMLDKG